MNKGPIQELCLFHSTPLVPFFDFFISDAPELGLTLGAYTADVCPCSQAVRRVTRSRWAFTTTMPCVRPYSTCPSGISWEQGRSAPAPQRRGFPEGLVPPLSREGKGVGQGNQVEAEFAVKGRLRRQVPVMTGPWVERHGCERGD